MAIDDRCKLFVAGLPDSITETVLRQLFEATGGSVVDVSVPRDRATGRPRGFGFVTLSSEEQAQAARDVLDGSIQSGRSISVRPFQAAPPKRPEGGAPGPRVEGGAPQGGGEDRTLYLGNLPYDATASEVETLLQASGVPSVVRVNLPLDPTTGRPRGFGFVTLGSAEAAQTAVDALRDVMLKGRRISASIAHARGERPPRPMGGGPGGPPPWQSRSEPRWAPDMGGGGDPGGPPPVAAEDDGRRRGGPKDSAASSNKKKKARGPVDRGRSRRDGEGLRGPRARGRYGEEDD